MPLRVFQVFPHKDGTTLRVQVRCNRRGVKAFELKLAQYSGVLLDDDTFSQY